MAKRLRDVFGRVEDEDGLDTLGLPENFFRVAVFARTPSQIALVDCDFAVYIGNSYPDKSREAREWMDMHNKIHHMRMTLKYHVEKAIAEFRQATTKLASLVKLKDYGTVEWSLHDFIQRTPCYKQHPDRLIGETLNEVFERTRDVRRVDARMEILQRASHRAADYVSQYRIKACWALTRLDFGKPSYAYKPALWANKYWDGACIGSIFLVENLHPDDKLMHAYYKMAKKLALQY